MGSEIPPGELITARAAWFITTVSMAIAVSLGLAIHVAVRDPRQPIRWALGAFCFRRSLPE